MDPVVARKTWRTLEPIHGMIYFAPEAASAYDALGLDGSRMGYFASRSAAMGPVAAEVVIATFFNFHPSLVRSCIPAAWERASPEAILAARLDGADRSLRRALGDAVGSAELREAAELTRRAALVACDHPEGRPLFAGHASLPWPDEPHLVLWQAQALLREFRGDAHIAALVLDGLSGVEALVVHAATGEVPAPALQSTRAWSDEEWAGAVDRLRSRGLLAAGEPLALSDDGRRRRQAVEDRTDEASVVAYETLGDDGCERLRSLARPFSRAIVDTGFLG